MLITSDGRFALMFSVRCALDPSRSVSADGNGAVGASHRCGDLRESGLIATEKTEHARGGS